MLLDALRVLIKDIRMLEVAVSVLFQAIKVLVEPCKC